MPFVRIDLSKDIPAPAVQAISDAVYDAMFEFANAPPHDKFQIITRHDRDSLVYPSEGYLGETYTPNFVFIQVTWNAGRSIDVKKAFYKAVAETIHSKTGLRKQDVFINLVSVEREDWSFGSGIMHYAPKEWRT
ncbi:4-oxalocrotonate tautomerase [Pararobbsia alpina]|uniref:tautomerase family protein n=1 Tax=Pararobbsia alpina TaxID=621374 RepID=UPI0039A5A15D